jgi:hypothetical protein
VTGNLTNQTRCLVFLVRLVLWDAILYGRLSTLTTQLCEERRTTCIQRTVAKFTLASLPQTIQWQHVANLERLQQAGVMMLIFMVRVCLVSYS